MSPKGLVYDRKTKMQLHERGDTAVAEQGGETIAHQFAVLEILLRMALHRIGVADGVLIRSTHIMVEGHGKIADLDGMLEQRGIEIEVFAQEQIVRETNTIQLAATPAHEFVATTSVKMRKQLSQYRSAVQRCGLLTYMLLMIPVVEIVVADDHVGIVGYCLTI